MGHNCTRRQNVCIASKACARSGAYTYTQAPEFAYDGVPPRRGGGGGTPATKRRRAERPQPLGAAKEREFKRGRAEPPGGGARGHACDCRMKRGTAVQERRSPEPPTPRGSDPGEAPTCDPDRRQTGMQSVHQDCTQACFCMAPQVTTGAPLTHTGLPLQCCSSPVYGVGTPHTHRHQSMQMMGHIWRCRKQCTRGVGIQKDFGNGRGAAREKSSCPHGVHFFLPSPQPPPPPGRKTADIMNPLIPTANPPSPPRCPTPHFLASSVPPLRCPGYALAPHIPRSGQLAYPNLILPLPDVSLPLSLTCAPVWRGHASQVG